jgi:hypothetical protein
MNVQNFQAGGNNIGFAGPNYYRGYNAGTTAMQTGASAGNVRIVRGGFSGSESDAFVNDQRMTLYPRIKVNNALSASVMVDFAGIRHKYNHGDVVTNGPFERYYEDRVSRNAYDTAMIPSITQSQIHAHTPWGVVSVGQKDLPFGTGALLALNSRGSAYVMVIPFGPFRFIPSVWVANNIDGFQGYASYNPAGALPTYTPSPDSAYKNTFMGSPGITYTSGSFDIGSLLLLQPQHANSFVAGSSIMPYFIVDYRTTANAIIQTIQYHRGYDTSQWGGMAYLKYNNGRSFLNVEYGALQTDVTYIGYSPAGTGPAAAPKHYERSYAFAEGGVLAGPAKLGLMFAWTPGDAINDNNPTKVYGGYGINYQATLPYQFLMFHTYAGGTDAPWLTGTTSMAPHVPTAAFTYDENGQMGDAYALAARLDYALAANLNVWGSYLWAHRVEQNGFRRGGKLSTGLGATPEQAMAWKNTHYGANASPYVSDGHIGWEMGLGVDWKLLEGMALNMRWAYWQPGKWFEEAYQAVAIDRTDGFLQGRDAINAFEASLLVSF